MTTIIEIEKSAGNPTLNSNAMPENIVKVGATYWTCYRGNTGGADDIRLASAPDPEGPWTPYAGNPVLVAGGGWEAGRYLDTPFLVDEGGGAFSLFYNAFRPDADAGDIGRARATAAITGPYVKDVGNPVLARGAGAAWDSAYVRGPSLLQLADTTWVMAYNGASSSSPSTTGRIGYATSATLNGPWTKAAANPVLGVGATGRWDDTLIDHPHLWQEDDDTFWMLYTGAAGTGGATPVIGFPWGIGIATAVSLDGPWTKHPSNPFLPPGGIGAWDQGGPFRGGVWKESGIYYLIYAGLDISGSNPKGGTATLEFVPTPSPIGWDVYAAAEPNGAILVTLEHAYNRSFRDELQGPGKGGFKINRNADEVQYLADGNIVKVRIPELGDDYVFAFELENVAATLAAADESGGEELTLSGRGIMAYLDRAEMLDRAFTTGLDISDTWTKLWQTGAVSNPVGIAVDPADSTYVWMIGETTRKIYKVRQSDRHVVAASPALFPGYASGLSLDPSDATIFWALEAPWLSGSSAHTKIHKIRRSDYANLATYDLGSAIKHTDIRAGGTYLWLSRYDGTVSLYKRSKASGAVVNSYTVVYGGVTQTKMNGVSVNGTDLALWYQGTKRALLATEAAPTTITGKISTSDISSFGGEWTTEGGQDYFYMVSYTVDQAWKYQLTVATPHDPVDGIWRLDEGTAIAIAKRVIDEFQDPSRPQQPIPDLTVDFTATTDSNGDLADVIAGVLEYTANIGDKGMPTILRLSAYGPTFRMSPELVLSAYNSFGVDRSSATFAAGKVRLEKGVSIASGVQRANSVKQLDSYMLAGGDNHVYAEATLDDFGYVREGFVSTRLTDTSALAGTAEAELERERTLAESVVLGVRWGDDELNGKYLPYVHYGPGDIIRAHTGTGSRDFDEASLGIYALQVDEGPADDWTAQVELTSSYPRKGVSSTSGGTSASGSGTSSGGTGSGSTAGTGSLVVTVRDGVTGDQASGLTIESDDFGVFQDSPGVVGVVVKPPSLDELSNVEAGGKANGDRLIWDDVAAAWVPEPAGSTGSSEREVDGALTPRATITAVKNAANPTFAFAAVPESIVKVGDVYWATFMDGTSIAATINLAYSSSRDGPWTAYAGNPIYQITDVPWAAGSTGIYAPFVMEHDGTFYLFYSIVVSGGAASAGNAIGVATAPTVIGPWTDHGSSIIAPGAGAAWDSRRIGECDLVYHDGRWVMAYMGETSAAAYQHSEKIGTAVASSPFGPWTKSAANPVIDFGTAGAWDDGLCADPSLIFENGYYWIMYAGETGAAAPAKQGLAYSLDPTTAFTRYAGNPILGNGGAGTFDESLAFRGSLWVEDGLYGGIYCGQATSGAYRGGNYRLTVDVAAIGALTVKDEGVALATAAASIDFVGAGVTASGAGAAKTVTVPGNPLTVKDEGVALATVADTLDFVGAGVVASGTGGTKTITIAGSSSPSGPAGGQLSGTYPNPLVAVHDEPLTDGASNFIFVGGDVVVVTGVPNP